MDQIMRLFLRIRELAVRAERGQTMTEYALILAAIALVVYGSYQALGNSVSTAVSRVDNTLITAS